MPLPCNRPTLKRPPLSSSSHLQALVDRADAEDLNSLQLPLLSVLTPPAFTLIDSTFSRKRHLSRRPLL